MKNLTKKSSEVHTGQIMTLHVPIAMALLFLGILSTNRKTYSGSMAAEDEINLRHYNQELTENNLVSYIDMYHLESITPNFVNVG